jgi:hypothetical protein
MSDLVARVLQLFPAVVTLLLALIGSFFKDTVKKDANGDPMRRHGFPVLSKTGWILLIALLVSSGFSIKSMLSSAQRAHDAEETLQRVDTTTATTLTTQVKRFQDILDQQAKIGETTIGRISQSSTELKQNIDNSTSNLKTGIDDSTALLGGRVDHSITLLNHSADKITSLTDPITTMKTSWTRVALPLNGPRQQSQRQTLDDYARQINQKTVSFEQMPDSIRQSANSFAMVTIAVSLYKIPLSDKVLQKGELPSPDLSFWITNASTGISGYYDAEKHCLYANIQDVLIVPRLDDRLRNNTGFSIVPWDKKAAGAINGIPDLLNAQLVATIGIPGASGINDPVSELAHQLQINRLDIMMSDELYLTFDADGPYTDHIFGWTRAHRMRQMRQLKARTGETLYVYQLPGSMAELVGSPSIP